MSMRPRMYRPRSYFSGFIRTLDDVSYENISVVRCSFANKNIKEESREMNSSSNMAAVILQCSI